MIASLATSDPGLESLSDEDRSEVGQDDMADEQPPTDTSACVPAHELEDHDRSEIEILRDNLRGPEAESAPVASQGPSEGEPGDDGF